MHVSTITSWTLVPILHTSRHVVVEIAQVAPRVTFRQVHIAIICNEAFALAFNIASQRIYAATASSLSFEQFDSSCC